MPASTNFRLLNVVFKFMKGLNCFKFLKRRIPEETCKLLRRLVSLKCKIAREHVKVAFLNNCVNSRRFPYQYMKLLKRNNLKTSSTNLRRIATAHLETAQSKLVELLQIHSQLASNADALSFCCRIVFIQYCKSTVDRCKITHNDRLQKSLMKPQSETTPRDPSKYVANYSSVQLNDLQVEALSFGLNYKIKPNQLNRIHIEAQFENLFQQLSVAHPKSQDQQSWFKTKLTDIAYDFLLSPIRENCAVSKQHIHALRELKEKDIVVLRPDKGSGAVVMDKVEYMRKMQAILDDSSKFERLQKVEDAENIEKRISRHLELLHKLRLIDERTFRLLKPGGTVTPQLYGLPKTHKAGIPLRPVLAMANSPYHKLARWLVQLLAPIRQRHSKFGTKDTFELIDSMQSLNIADKLLCSADVQSLFTNVPLHETIDYICELVERENDSVTFPIPTDLLKESLLICTENIDFYFLNSPYRQIDGVAMGSPLGPVLADFFMSKMEEQLSDEISKLVFYRRYVDDTLIFCDSKQQFEALLEKMNGVHPNLRVTSEFESDGSLPFLDILISRREDGSIKRSVYRKSTWSGQYLHFTSFTPIREKRALVQTLFSRARKICSQDCLAKELELVRNTLLSNGYPEGFINKHSQPSVRPPKPASVSKLKVYIELPFKGDMAMRQTTQRLSASLQSTYNAAELRVINKTQRLPLPLIKGNQPVGAKSHCIYQFTCDCGDSYIGRTDRCLKSRIKEHLPKWVLRAVETGPVEETARRLPASSIARHLLTSGHNVNPDKAFRVVLSHPNPRFLRFAEAVAIGRFRG